MKKLIGGRGVKSPADERKENRKEATDYIRRNGVERGCCLKDILSDNRGIKNVRPWSVILLRNMKVVPRVNVRDIEDRENLVVVMACQAKVGLETGKPRIARSRIMRPNNILIFLSMEVLNDILPVKEAER